MKSRGNIRGEGEQREYDAPAAKDESEQQAHRQHEVDAVDLDAGERRRQLRCAGNQQPRADENGGWQSEIEQDFRGCHAAAAPLRAKWCSVAEDSMRLPRQRLKIRYFISVRN